MAFPSTDPKEQRELLTRWVPILEGIPSIDLVSLDGSLANNAKANPNSDIDIRIAIRDSEYRNVWEENPTMILGALGTRIPLAGNWRHLTWDGLIVEIMVIKTSELDGMTFPDWEILFSRLPVPPKFDRIPDCTPAETWPETDELEPDAVARWTKVFLLAMAHTPSVYFRRETVAMRLQLDWMREELLKMIYRHFDLRAGVRPRHLSTIFSTKAMTDLESTYISESESISDTGAIAQATLRTLGLIRDYLKLLDGKAGGGFEPEWYNRMHGLLKDRLKLFG
jgi:hypothetical protein